MRTTENERQKMRGELSLNGRRTEKTTEVSQGKVPGGRRDKCALNSELSMKIQPDQAQHGHPEQHATA
jgi:hypothetical protein